MNNYSQSQFSDYTVVDSHQVPINSVSKKFMAGVFSWMFAALAISSVFAILFSQVESLSALLHEEVLGRTRLTGFGSLISFAPLAFVLVITFGINKLSSSALSGILIAFSAAMGMSLSTLALVYTSGSLFTCFASSAGMFGVMAVMGYTTDKDLTKFGSILQMGVIGLVIAMMINFFMHSPALNYLISLVGVGVFLGLTAFDIQKLKRIGAGAYYQNVMAIDTKKLVLLGALTLYLDFINIFLFMLELFGNKRRD